MSQVTEMSKQVGDLSEANIGDQVRLRSTAVPDILSLEETS